MEEDALNPRAVDGSQTPIVGHVVVVGFHAKLGSRIEFSYPKLRGSVELRTPRLNDTQDVASDDGVTEDRSQKYVSSGDWGCLPQAWSFLPLMALPDGAHDSEDDTAYFCLPPHVHCVACFRQTNASVAVNFNAGGQDADDSVAARGSVQKSVVLLCKRPIYGVLGDRLSGVVRAYFDQGDFSRTDVLAKLYHSINNSLSRPSLNDLQILVHGLDLRALVRSLRADTLKIIKLILLEKRIVFISQPVRYACNAVASIASVFPAAFDRMSPSMKPLDNSVENEAYGLPLELLAEGDRMTFQPYAPLPSINEILKDNLQGCLIGTSRNCGFLLKTAMSGDTKQNVPRVDAVVDIHTGQLTMRKELEAACAITRSEHVFITDLILAANQSVESSGALEYICSDDYIRVRLREYLRRFLGSAAALEGVLQPGEIDPKAEPPPIMDMATAERMDWSPVKNYNEVFGRQWVLWTRNCRAWARKCKPEVAQVRGPPLPQLKTADSTIKRDLAWFLGDGLATTFFGGRVPAFSTTDAVQKMTEVSSRAYEGVSGLFQRLETELKGIETAILEQAEESRRTTDNRSQPSLRENLDILVHSDSGDITNMRTPKTRLSTSIPNDVVTMPTLAPSIYEKP